MAAIDELHHMLISCLGVCLLFGVGCAWVDQKGKKENSRSTAAITVGEIVFDPLRQGENSVAIGVQNPTDQPQIFALHIQSKTPGGRGWGKPFFERLKPQAAKRVHFAFEIPSLAQKSWVRLRFYNPISEEAYQFDEYFREEKYVGSTMEQYREASPEVKSAITASFTQFQDAIRQEKYRDAWALVSREIRQEHGNDFTRFEQGLATGPNDEKRMLLELKAQSVLYSPSLATLEASREEQVWKIDFAAQETGWKVLVINPPSGMDRRKMKLEQIKTTMENRRTQHFDIYYEPDSPAARDMAAIVDQRERGAEKIRAFLGVSPRDQVTLIFFEDAEVKRQKTGHQGDGWAFGTTIVEVYNEEVRLDPYHELTHVLARQLGDPPALFNEGLATYMSEYMGASPLVYMGGGDLSLYERVRRQKREGAWIPLEELLTYTDIGPAWSQPAIAYPEAGAFVKFLLDTFGREKFFQAYRLLSNAGSDAVYKKNIAGLEELFGVAVEELRTRWYKDMGI